MIRLHQMSTITKHRLDAAPGLGREIRRRRRGRGLTQSELGWPLTRAFVSAVEHGRCLPSLAALALFAERLGVSPAALLDPVKHQLASMYTVPDDPGDAFQGS
jgi:transcriptional regulator with XRE-family HTH domain